MKFNPSTAEKVTVKKLPKTALVLVAAGCHELEVATINHVLNSAGVEVTLANVNGYGSVKCSHGMVIVTDEGVKDIPSSRCYGAVLIPGGEFSQWSVCLQFMSNSQVIKQLLP